MDNGHYWGFDFPDHLIPKAAGVGHAAALADYKAKLADHAFALAQLDGNPVTLADFKEILKGKSVAGYTYEEHKAAFGMVRSCQYLADNSHPITQEGLTTHYDGGGYAENVRIRSAIRNREINELSPYYELSGYPERDYLGYKDIRAGFDAAIRLFIFLGRGSGSLNVLNSLLIAAGHKAILVPTARIKELQDAWNKLDAERELARKKNPYAISAATVVVDATELVTLLVDLQK